MPHDHSHHGHSHAPADGGDWRVWVAIAVNGLLTLVQIVAGLLSGSLALIADAIHNLSDALSLVIALVARRIARRPADARMTFGYARAEVVAALINYTTLIVIALYLAVEGVGRLLNPAEVEGWTVVIVAIVALIVDAATVLLMFTMRSDGVNIRAAFLHNLADALGSVAVIVSGILILLYDWRLADPLVTLLIAGYILWHAAVEIGPVIRILMLASPDHPRIEEVLGHLNADPGVASVHHMHLWRMQEHEVALDAHIVLSDGVDPQDLRDRLKRTLGAEFGIHHATMEMERAGAACTDAPVIGH